MDAIETGSGCAALGQDEVQAEEAKVAAAKLVVQNAKADVASKTDAKDTAASAPYTVTFDLMSTSQPNCLDVSGESSYLAVKNARDTAIAELEAAETAQTAAEVEVTAAESARDLVVAEASRLMSGCLCRIHKEQAAAWASVSTATAAHAADWKQAHEVICSLDQTTTCTIPTCPTVTQPTVAAGVATADSEHCTPEPTPAPTTCDPYRCPPSHPVCMGHHRALPYGRCARPSWNCYGDGSCDAASGTVYPTSGGSTYQCQRHYSSSNGTPRC